MTVTSIGPGSSPDPGERARRAAEIGALRAALHAETLIAEALAQRSRGLVDLIESLARRALAEAADLADASRRLDALSRGMRTALAEGEVAARGNLAALAGRTLAPFDAGPGPRIAISGPAVEISADAAQLVALTLFELGALSARQGALASPEGRASLRWLRHERGLRIVWRDCGGAPRRAGPGLGAGAGLLPLLEERFGAPLKVRVGALGLHAELTLPESEVAPHVSLVAAAGSGLPGGSAAGDHLAASSAPSPE